VCDYACGSYHLVNGDNRWLAFPSNPGEAFRAGASPGEEVSSREGW
jgi:hypothetical protein